MSNFETWEQNENSRLKSGYLFFRKLNGKDVQRPSAGTACRPLYSSGGEGNISQAE